MHDYESSSEQELIKRAKRGDVKAFSQLYAAIYKDLYRFALYVTRHEQNAEDAVSEAVISAFENISELRKDTSFKSWMFTILNNRCRKIMMRENGKTSEIPDKKEFSTDPDYARQQDVKRAFEALDEDDRIIIAFSVFGGYKSEEIAGMMEKNAATVRSRKRRAFEQMRKMLGT